MSLALPLSLIGAFTIALLAFKLRALSRSGLIAATLVGGIITFAGGWQWGLLLLAFFITSSALSKIADRHRTPQAVTADRGSQRDAWQVLANGGIATLCAVAAGLSDASVWFVMFAAALATASADTWATEIGSFNHQSPRLITSFRTVPPGTSGAISLLGTGGAFAGGSTIAFLALLVSQQHPDPSIRLFCIVALAGPGGSLFDSLLGATVQQRRWCPSCQQLTERTIHHCGTVTVHHSGLSWMTNDMVNLLSILSGTLCAAAAWLLL